MMSGDRTPDYLISLVAELCKMPAETGWLEFKEYFHPEDVGQYLSALSNTAALVGKANAYVIWGIRDGTHEVVGTAFKPSQEKKGGEALESWLLRLLNPRLHFRFHELTFEGQPVALLEIPRAPGRPVQFRGVEFVRRGTGKRSGQGSVRNRVSSVAGAGLRDTGRLHTRLALHSQVAPVHGS